MLDLLAQAPRQQSGFLDLVEKLARTPISSILIFAVLCTLVRVALSYYVTSAPTAGRKGFLPRISHWIHDLADALVYAGILVFLLIRPFAVQTFRIPTESMVPTLLVGDLLIVNKAVYRLQQPKAGDIVVFKPPPGALQAGDDPNIDFVKRLIGAPGDLVVIEDSVLKRNGNVVPEPYLNDTRFGDFKLVEYPKDSGNVVPILRDDFGRMPRGTIMEATVKASDMAEIWTYSPAWIPPGKYLMMGDNRNQSFDGRSWGLIGRERIVGKAWVTFFPFGRAGFADKRR